ncbi:MAG: hypothetical protein LBS40_00155 [Burkholderiales bacterium]|jgi:hypothetical protein|nr:hypothetical protein [Burkholderiales bacterium]
MKKFFDFFCTAAAVVLFAASAQAAIFQYSDPECDSFTLADSGSGVFIISCVKDGGGPDPNAPTDCMASADPTFFAFGVTPAQPTIAMTCVGNASDTTTYTWTRTSFTGDGAPTASFSGASFSDSLPGNTGDADIVYVYTGQACNGASCASPSTASVTMVKQGGSGPTTPSAPTSCVLNLSVTNLPNTGGNVTLTASSCAGTDANTTYQFFKNGTSLADPATSVTHVINLPANTTSSPVTSNFYVKVCNGALCMDTATKSVTVAAGSGGGGTLCAQYNVVYDGTLAKGTQREQTGMGAMQVFVGSFVAAQSGSGVGSAITLTSGLPGNYTVTISTQKCDFRPRDETGVAGPLVRSSMSSMPSAGYSIGSASGNLTAGQTYYINLIPGNGSGVNSCAQGRCDVRISHK